MMSTKLKKKSKTDSDNIQEDDSEVTMDTEGEGHELPGEVISTEMVARGHDSTIHTAMEHLHLDSTVGWLKLQTIVQYTCTVYV